MKKTKKTLLISLFCLLLLLIGCTPKTKLIQKYGVFLGINGDEESKLEPYQIVVIEPSEFTTKQITKLKTSGKTVYGYLNIGALEEYRPYYDDFKDLALGTYEDWPNEKWINVASSTWQNFIVNELAKAYVDMGFDGFFLDNADVYYNFPTQDIFDGLKNILAGLKEYNITLIINGGDTFVSKCMEKDIATSLFDGVNQETVFTNINFENDTYGIQDDTETTYFKNYLSEVKKHGLKVFLLEYGANDSLSKTIDAYCIKNGFTWYNAKSLELK